MGTFLDDEKQIPEANWQALLACAARGIQIVPATGRTVRGIPDRIRTLPGVRYAITTNGAVVADLKEDRIISTCRIPVDTALRVVRGIPDRIRTLPGVRYAITTNGAVVADLKEDRIISTCRIPVDTALRVLEMARDSGDDIMYDAYMDGIGCTTQYFYDHAERYAVSAGVAALIRKTRRVVPDNIRYVKEMGKEIDKINMFFTDMEARKRMRVSLGQIPGILVTSSIPNNLEINAAGADKGSALLRLAEFLGIGREETMAFGDGENDLSMLRAAGLGVAMENGEEQVKQAADFVTVSNNDAGVASAIRKFVLE